MSGPRVTVVAFPGSNCDEDALIAARNTIGADARNNGHTISCAFDSVQVTSVERKK